MKNYINTIAFLLSLTLFLAIPFDSRSNSITITTSQNWSAITGGSGTGGAPGSGDAITINGGATVTVNVSNAICSTLLVSHQAVLTFNSSSQLTVGATGTGLFTLGVASGSGRWATLSMTNGGTLNCGNITSANASNIFNTTNGTVIISTAGSVTLGANLILPSLTISGGGTVTLGSTPTINGNITINPTCTLSQGPNSVTLKGNLVNNGTFIGSAGFFDLGGTSPQTIGGPSETVFQTLRLNNSSGAVLSGHIKVNTSLLFFMGCITLTTYNLTMGPASGSIMCSENNYIITNDNPASGGCLIMYANGLKFFPVGTSTNWTPVTVNNTGAPDYFRVRVFSGVYSEGTSGDLMTHCVNRTWLVEESVPDSSIVKLTMQWNFDDEIEFERGNCAVFHYTGGEWDDSAFAAASVSAPYSRSRSGITSFSPFTVGDNNIAPLPVELLFFEAKSADKNTNAVNLSWATATEINNSHFEIERSADGKNFNSIGNVAGAGNSTRILSYEFTDNNPIPAGISYYRLKQVDFDGTTSYSSLELVGSADKLVLGNPYPIPAQDILFMPLEAGLNGKCIVEIFDISARLVYYEEFNSGSSAQTVSIPTSDLLTGIYFLSVSTNEQRSSVKFLK